MKTDELRAEILKEFETEIQPYPSDLSSPIVKEWLKDAFQRYGDALIGETKNALIRYASLSTAPISPEELFNIATSLDSHSKQPQPDTERDG